MPCFRVRFLKEVTTDTGTDVEMLQAAFDVKAVDESQAEDLAKTRFCSDRNIHHWDVNADRVAVELHPDDFECGNGAIVKPASVDR